MKKKSLSLSPLYLLIVCSIGIAALYWPGLSGPFLLDDLANIAPTDLKEWDLRTLFSIVFDNHSGPLGRPLSILSFSANYFFLGESVYYFKLVNLGLHLACGGLIYLLARQLFRLKPISKAPQIAWGIAIIWLIHPLLVSTVLYSVQRMTILSAFFSLLGLTTYLRYRQETLHHAINWLIAVCALGFFGTLAVLSKETALLLPAYVLLIEWVFFEDSSIPRRIALSFIAIPLFLSIILFISYWPEWQAEYIARSSSIFERLYTQSHVLFYYFQLMIYPDLSQLSLYHDDFPSYSHLNISTILSLSAIATLLFIALISRRTFPWLSFGVAWFFISHSIESTIIPLETAFEHRNYLALLGLLLPLGAACSTIKSKRLGLYFFILAIILSALTYQRVQRWSSLSTLTEAHLHNHPQSFRAQIDSANLAFEREELQKGFIALEEAQELIPHNPGPSMHTLLIACQYDEVTSSMLTQAENKLVEGADFSYSLFSFALLTRTLASESCPPLSSEVLTNLLETSIQNPQLIYRPSQRFDLYFILGP